MRNDEFTPFITFELNSERFAIEQIYLHSVTRPMALSPLPFVSDCFDGMLNIDSQIVPQINSDLISAGSKKQTCDTLIIIEYQKKRVALPVSQLQVENVYLPEQKEKNFVKNIQGKDSLNLPMNCINIPVLLEQLSPLTHELSLPSVYAGEYLPESVEKTKKKDYLIVDFIAQILAVPMSEIKKIVALDNLTLLPYAPHYLLGTSLIDDCAVHFMNGIKTTMETGKETCLLFEKSDYYFGVVIDQQYGLQTFHDSDIFSGEDTEQLSIMRDGLSIPIAQLEHFISARQQSEIRPFNTLYQRREAAVMPKRSLLTLITESAFFGIDSRHIYRILPKQHIEPFPFEQAGILGSIEFEGNVVPILRTLFLLINEGDEKEILILKNNNALWGFCIPRSEGIVMIDTHTLSYVHQDERHAIEAYASYQGKPLAIINTDWLCSVNLMDEPKVLRA